MITDGVEDVVLALIKVFTEKDEVKKVDLTNHVKLISAYFSFRVRLIDPVFRNKNKQNSY